MGYECLEWIELDVDKVQCWFHVNKVMYLLVS
jgi:hypothetical protein